MLHRRPSNYCKVVFCVSGSFVYNDASFPFGMLRMNISNRVLSSHSCFCSSLHFPFSSPSDFYCSSGNFPRIPREQKWLRFSDRYEYETILVSGVPYPWVRTHFIRQPASSSACTRTIVSTVFAEMNQSLTLTEFAPVGNLPLGCPIGADGKQNHVVTKVVSSRDRKHVYNVKMDLIVVRVVKPYPNKPIRSFPHTIYVFRVCQKISAQNWIYKMRF